MAIEESVFDAVEVSRRLSLGASEVDEEELLNHPEIVCPIDVSTEGPVDSSGDDAVVSSTLGTVADSVVVSNGSFVRVFSGSLLVSFDPPENHPETVSPIEVKKEDPVDSVVTGSVTLSSTLADVVESEDSYEGILVSDAIVDDSVPSAGDVVTSIDLPEDENQPETVSPIEVRNEGPASSCAVLVNSTPSAAAVVSSTKVDGLVVVSSPRTGVGSVDLLEDENQPDTVSPIEDRNDDPVDSSVAMVVESPLSSAVVFSSTGVGEVESEASPVDEASLATVVLSAEPPDELNHPETVLPIEDRNDGPVDSSGA